MRIRFAIGIPVDATSNIRSPPETVKKRSLEVRECVVSRIVCVLHQEVQPTFMRLTMDSIQIHRQYRHADLDACDHIANP